MLLPNENTLVAAYTVPVANWTQRYVYVGCRQELSMISEVVHTGMSTWKWIYTLLNHTLQSQYSSSHFEVETFQRIPAHIMFLFLSQIPLPAGSWLTRVL